MNASPDHSGQGEPFWKRLFSDTAFSWEFRMRSGDTESFFAPCDASGRLRAEKNKWLDADARRYARVTPPGKHLVEAAWEMALGWGHVVAPRDGTRDLVSLARQWEPDLLLVDHATMSVAAGCVCMPSSWDLRHAAGKSLDEVHELVPRLNAQIGGQIGRFLKRIQPGKAELNYHPELKRRPLDETVGLDEVFLRVEHQLFTGVPGGILMGIRIENAPLPDLAADREVWRIALEKIRTMPDEVAAYKSMDVARPAILRAMEGYGCT
jgi:hypothetical protein